MIWTSTLGIKVIVADDALSSITGFVSARRSGETGGILIGRYSDDLSVATIESATGPGSKSLFGAFSFVRKTSGLQKELNRAFVLGRYYLGEWHCHPGGSHFPSRQDVCQMQAIARSKEYNCPEPILIVLGRDNPGELISTFAIRNDELIIFERSQF